MTGQPDPQVPVTPEPTYDPAPQPQYAQPSQAAPTDFGQQPVDYGQQYQQPYQTYQQQPQQAPVSNRTAGIGSPQKDKWVAAILAFLLGTFGIHKFYLGYKTEGTIMLVVTVVGAICTLGLGSLVMMVISYIEAVRYIILTQEDFERTYMMSNKGWL